MELANHASARARIGRRSRRRTIALSVVFAAAGIGFWVPTEAALGAPSVTAVDLGTLGGSSSVAFKVNDLGQVTGHSDIAPDDSTQHAFSWTPAGGMVDLGTLGGTNSGPSFVSPASNQGLVVGWSDTAGNAAQHAFVWSQSSGMIDLGAMGGTGSEARAANATGQVVGVAYGYPDGSVHGFSWTAAGGMVDIGTLGGNYSMPNFVSDSGKVVGVSYRSLAADPNGYGHAFSWTQAGGMVDLGTIIGPYETQTAYAANSSGQAVGSFSRPGVTGAFSWTQSGGMLDIGSLGGGGTSAVGVADNGVVTGTSSYATSHFHGYTWTQAGGMNDIGDITPVHISRTGLQIVGSTFATSTGLSHAMSWTRSAGLIDLQLQSGGDSNWLSEAYGVNTRGQVVGYESTPVPGNPSLPTHATLWQTTPPGPDAVSLSPANGSDYVGATHTVTAAATGGSQPIQGSTILFTVTGSVSAAGSCVTNAAGQCTYAYTGPQLPGSDTIRACADNNNNGSADAGDPCGQANESWTLPPSNTGSATTGGGQFRPSTTGTATVGFNATSSSKGVSGNCNLVVKTGKSTTTVKCTKVTTFVRSGNRATFFGPATVNGAATTYRIDVADVREPGAGADTFAIRTASGYVASGTLTTGNIQVR
jgi:probable HAF family extracellular repeat protein